MFYFIFYSLFKAFRHLTQTSTSHTSFSYCINNATSPCLPCVSSSSCQETSAGWRAECRGCQADLWTARPVFHAGEGPHVPERPRTKRIMFHTLNTPCVRTQETLWSEYSPCWLLSAPRMELFGQKRGRIVSYLSTNWCIYVNV